MLMSKEQIEEMAFDLYLIDMCKHLPQEECHNTTCAHCEAEALYNAGYRKQSEGEWREDFDGDCYCTACGYYPKKDVKNYCPNCGAKMIATDTNVGDKKGCE